MAVREVGVQTLGWAQGASELFWQAVRIRARVFSFLMETNLICQHRERKKGNSI